MTQLLGLTASLQKLVKNLLLRYNHPDYLEKITKTVWGHSSVT